MSTSFQNEKEFESQRLRLADPLTQLAEMRSLRYLEEYSSKPFRGFNIISLSTALDIEVYSDDSKKIQKSFALIVSKAHGFRPHSPHIFVQPKQNKLHIRVKIATLIGVWDYHNAMNESLNFKHTYRDLYKKNKPAALYAHYFAQSLLMPTHQVEADTASHNNDYRIARDYGVPLHHGVERVRQLGLSTLL